MEPTPRHYIAGEVRAEMARQGKQHREVGEVLARVRGRILTRQAVGRKMAGLASFTTDELIVLAQWLNVPVAQFLPDTLDVAS
jgi:hypothetical protein